MYVSRCFLCFALLFIASCEQPISSTEFASFADESNAICLQQLSPQTAPECPKGFLLHTDYNNKIDYCCEGSIAIPKGEGKEGLKQRKFCVAATSCPVLYDLNPGLSGDDCQLNECAAAGYDTDPYTGACTCACDESFVTAEMTSSALYPQCPSFPGLVFLKYKVDGGDNGADICIYEDSITSRITKVEVSDSMCRQESLQVLVGQQDVCANNLDGFRCPEGMLLQPNGTCTTCFDPCTSSTIRIYTHTAHTLFSIDPDTLEVETVGEFNMGSGAKEMVDIAIDNDGTIYGINNQWETYLINPETAQAQKIGDIDDRYFNSLAFVPDPDDPEKEILIAAKALVTFGTGEVSRINTLWGFSTPVGEYRDGWGSSGDIVYIPGVGIVAAVEKDQDGTIVSALATIDPVTFEATIIGETNHSEIWGLAFWDDILYGFTSAGEIIGIDLDTGNSWEIETSTHSWYGAGVTTRDCRVTHGAGNGTGS